jgi:integrase
MATIRRRGDRWQCRVRRDGFPELTKSFQAREDAQKWARGVERQMDQGEYLAHDPALDQALGHLFDRYEREVTPSKKGSAQEKYRLAVLRADKLSALPLKALTPVEVAAFRDRRLQVVKPVTALHDLCVLSAVLEHARLEWGYSITNPVRAIRKPSMGKGRDRRLLDGEYLKLLTELRKCRSVWLAPLFEFAVESACRRGEALALKWSDVDLGKRIVVFRDTKTSDDRVIPLSTRAIETLAALPRDLQGFVFPVPATTLRSGFLNACKRAEITGLRWHDLRHEAVSRLHERGLSTIEVASISGHRTLACLSRYSHMRAEILAAKLA